MTGDKTTTIRWVSVVKGYPPPYSPCLVVAGGLVVAGTIFEWHSTKRRWCDHSGKRDEVRQDVTHWAEMLPLTIETEEIK